jgi:hypothetical protein
MEKEAPSVEADRDSPLAKTQRLGDISTPVHSSESQNARERDSNHAITEKTDLDASQPLVANLSNSQLDGQADEDEEKTAGQNNFEENRTIEVAVESPKSSTFVRKTQDEPFVEIEKSKSSPIETSSNYLQNSFLINQKQPNDREHAWARGELYSNPIRVQSYIFIPLEFGTVA